MIWQSMHWSTFEWGNGACGGCHLDELMSTTGAEFWQVLVPVNEGAVSNEQGGQMNWGALSNERAVLIMHWQINIGSS